MTRRTVLSLLSLAVSLRAGAQVPADSAKTSLERVTVTGTRSPMTPLQSPLAITLIGKEQIRHTRGYGLEDALNMVPGVITQVRSGNQDVRIMIRGFGARGAGDRSNAGTSRGIRVLVDGIPETEPDGRTSFDNVDLGIAEGVDVVRSNASSLWGNAAGGIVNVRTVPTFQQNLLSVQQMSGSFGLQRTAVRAGAALGAGTISASAVTSTFDGWRKGSDSKRALFNLSYSGRFADKTDLAILGVFSNNLFNIPGPLTLAEFKANPEQANATYLSRRERRYNRVGRLGVTVNHELNENNTIGGMAYVNPKSLQRSERGTYRDFTRYHVGTGLNYQNRATLGASTKSLLQVGVDQAYQDGAILFYSLTTDGERGTTLRDNKNEGANNVGAYVQEQLDFGRASLTLGARYDKIHYIFRSFITPKLNDQRDFERVTPKLGLVYRLSPTHTVYGNLGGGVEAPAGNETDPAGTFGQDTVYGINPLLDPIRSTTMEVGTKHVVSAGSGFLKQLVYDAAIYNTNVTNEIVPYRGGRFYFTAAKAKRRGAEIALSAALAGGLSFESAITLTKNTYENYFVDSVHYDKNLVGRFANYSGKNVVGLPKQMTSVAVGYRPAALHGVGVRLQMQHNGDFYADDANAVSVPGYTISNLTLSYDQPVLARGGVGVRAALGVNNLTDKTYIGSAFLNPDYVSGVPVAFEPGLPRNVFVSFALERMR